MTAGYAEFEFDLPGALLEQVVKTLDGLTAEKLAVDALAGIPDAQGVYQLFFDGKPVYVGKTDGQAGLKKRLIRHSRKILHRVGLDPSRVTFKAVRIFVFTAMDMETDLIRHYRGIGSLDWNDSGFGSNDPGKERDTTLNKPKNFDYKFPADIDRELDWDFDGGSARDMVVLLNSQLPYVIRAEQSSELLAAQVSKLARPFTARKAVEHLVGSLPPGWQATKLLGYIIIYKENRDYPQSQIIARSPAQSGVGG